MRIRAHGNTIAIALAGLAVVIATTGTAVAVTATQVNIADPTTPTRVAHVDSSSRLTTVGVTSSLAGNNVVRTSGIGEFNNITSPTTASLALTQIQVGNANPAASSDINAHYVLVLYKIGVSAGACSSAVSAIPLLQWTVAPETHIVDDLAAPLVIKTSGGAKYCLAIRGLTLTGDSDSGVFLAYYDFTGYVASGTYTGLGTLGTPTRADPRAGLVRKR